MLILLTAYAELNSSSNSTNPTPSKSPSSSVHHSETGAIAGGVVGGIVGSVLIILGGFFYLRRQRRRRHQQYARSQQQPPRDYSRQELDNSPETWTKKENNDYTLSATRYRDDRGIGELPTSTPVGQLGGNQIYEMPGERNRY